MGHKQGSSLSDYHEEWVALVDKAMTNFYSLTPVERIWYTAQVLIGDVDNGGFMAHYCNSGADYNRETIEDLITLGYSDVAEMLTEINRYFPGTNPPVYLNERNEIINTWTEEAYRLLDFSDKQFYKIEGDIERSLIRLIATNIVTR